MTDRLRVIGCWIGVTAAVGMGLIVRIYFLGEPLWIDELHTAWTVDAGLADVAGRAGQGNQTPLYFWLVRAVCTPSGLSEVSLRLPSLFFSVALIPCSAGFVWCFTKNIFGALLTAILVSLDPWCIFYGSEARPYALLQLLSICQAFSFARESKIELKPNSSAINWPLVISTGLMLLTHLTSMLLIVAELLFVLLFAQRLNWKRILLSLAIGMLALISVFGVGGSAFGKRGDWQSVTSAGGLLNEAMPSLLVYAFLPAAIVSAARLSSGSGKTDSMNLNAITFACCWGFVPLIIVSLLDLLNIVPMASFRYALIGWTAFPVLAGLLVSGISRPSIGLAAALLIVAASILINPIARSYYRDGEFASFRNEDWRSAVDELNREDVGDRQLVFLFANLVEDHRAGDPDADAEFIAYLKFPLTGIYRLRENAQIIPMPTRTPGRWTAEHMLLIRANNGAQIIARVPQDLLAAIPTELEELTADHSLNLRFEIKTQAGNVISIVNVLVED